MERKFTVDLADPADIATKVAEGERILREINQQLAGLAELQRESKEWRANVDFLASKISDDQRVDIETKQPDGTPTIAEAKSDGNGRVRPMDLVVEVVNREDRKVRALDVREILAGEGHDLAPEQVSNALHYAAVGADPKLIQKATGRGMYAPLAYREVEPPTPNGVALQGQPSDLQPASVGSWRVVGP